MQEEDIPLLTEVHIKSAQPIRSINITADLIAEIAAQIKPQLMRQIEEEVEASVTEKLRKKMHDYLVSEATAIEKSSQAYLADALKQQYALQSEQLDEKVNAVQEITTAVLRQHINDVLNISQQASHATLMELIQR